MTSKYFFYFFSLQTGTADGPFCAPFSILSNMCVDMPSMKGCQDWSAICSVPNTKVLQCKEQGPIPSVLRTEEAMDAIIEMCSTHSMEACQDCTVKWAKCADPMDTLSEVCFVFFVLKTNVLGSVYLFSKI